MDELKKEAALSLSPEHFLVVTRNKAQDVLSNPQSSPEQLSQAYNAIKGVGQEGPYSNTPFGIVNRETLENAAMQFLAHPNSPPNEEAYGAFKWLVEHEAGNARILSEPYNGMQMDDAKKRFLTSSFLNDKNTTNDPDVKARQIMINNLPGTLPTDIIAPVINQYTGPDSPLQPQRLDKLFHAMRGHIEQPKMQFKLGSNKLREVRDLAAQQPGGKIHKSTLEQLGLKPADLKIQDLQDGKGFIDADKVQQRIDSMPSLTYGISHSKYGEGSEKVIDPNADYPEYVDSPDWEKANEEHWNSFNPQDYGIDRRKYVDQDKALEDHIGNFNLDGDAHPRNYYADTPEGEQEWKDHVQEMQEKHAEKFDPDEYADRDEFMRPQYEKDLERAQEQHRDGFEFDPKEWGWKGKQEALEDAESEQRHNQLPSKVFQLDATPEHIQKMKDAGVYDMFNDITDASHVSGHPGRKGETVGWVRYTEHPNHIFIDEIQSDLGQSFVRQAAAHAKHAVENGEMNPQEANERLANIESKFPEQGHKKISQILFSGKDPNELIHEAFLQNLRDRGHTGKRVSMWTAPSKANISLDSPDPREIAPSLENIPAHMQRTYDQQPRKLGYRAEGQHYGNMSGEDNPAHEGKPTQAMTLRKREEDDLFLLERKLII